MPRKKEKAQKPYFLEGVHFSAKGSRRQERKGYREKGARGLIRMEIGGGGANGEKKGKGKKKGETLETGRKSRIPIKGWRGERWGGDYGGKGASKTRRRGLKRECP